MTGSLAVVNCFVGKTQVGIIEYYVFLSSDHEVTKVEKGELKVKYGTPFLYLSRTLSFYTTET